MEAALTQRSNEQWIAAITASATPDGVRALTELGRYVRGVLARVLRDRADTCDADLADFTQEALLRVIERAGTFRGESRFTTWAAAVATRVAFTELRRRAARRRGADVLDRVVREAGEPRRSDAAPADEVVAERHLLDALDDAIRTDLTERQRTAVVAELRGVPTVVIAERLGTNQNALYKLVHDARRKLRSSLARAGYDETSIRERVRAGGDR